MRMICYIILHYQDIDMTRRCIYSLLNNTVESKLIIVDNCSPNGSGKILQEELLENHRVTVIINSRNEGFASGNNMGYQFAKKQYIPEIMVVMNNDIIINDPTFELKIKEFFNTKSVDVLGPDIITPAGNHQNPLAYKPLTSDYIRRRIKVDRLKIIFLKINIFFKLYMLYKQRHPVKIRKKVSKEVHDCILHGSCVIYGNRYIEAENFAFVPVTYMYNEEAILYDYLKYKGYKIAYDPDVTVLHMQGSSTAKRIKDQKERIIFRFEKQTESAVRQLLEREKYNKG